MDEETKRAIAELERIVIMELAELHIRVENIARHLGVSENDLERPRGKKHLQYKITVSGISDNFSYARKLIARYGLLRLPTLSEVGRKLRTKEKTP